MSLREDTVPRARWLWHLYFRPTAITVPMVFLLHSPVLFQLTIWQNKNKKDRVARNVTLARVHRCFPTIEEFQKSRETCNGWRSMVKISGPLMRVRSPRSGFECSAFLERERVAAFPYYKVFLYSVVLMGCEIFTLGFDDHVRILEVGFLFMFVTRCVLISSLRCGLLST